MLVGYEEIVKTVIFDVIETDDDGLIFKLEVLSSSKGFRAQLSRQEMYTFKSTFAEFSPDEAIFVLDTHTLIDLDEQVFSDAQSCVDYVAAELAKKFS